MTFEDGSLVTKAFIEGLATLQTRLVDTLASYKKMRDTADPVLSPVLEAYIQLHAKHEEKLALRLLQLAEEPDEDGSFFLLVQRAVLETRSLFSVIDANILRQINSGEENILQSYRSAHQAAGDSRDRTMLERQIAELGHLAQKFRWQGKR